MLASARTLEDVKASMKRETILLGATQRHVLATAGDDDRDQTILHPSDIAKEKWCPKQDWYKLTSPISEAEVDTSFQMENIYEEGHEIHAKWQRRWAEMGVLWGRWHCHACGYRWVGLAMETGKPCPQCDASWFAVEYREYPLRLDTHMIGGSTDGVIILFNEAGEMEVYLVEVKSIGKGTVRVEWPALHRRIDRGEITMDEAWRQISRPFPAHIIQGMTYEHMARRSGHPILSQVKKILYIYECKWNQGVKELSIGYSYRLIEEKLDDAYEIAAAVRNNIEPPRPWDRKDKEPCKKCLYRARCWDEPPPPEPQPAIIRVGARKQRTAFKKLGLGAGG